MVEWYTVNVSLSPYKGFSVKFHVPNSVDSKLQKIKPLVPICSTSLLVSSVRTLPALKFILELPWCMITPIKYSHLSIDPAASYVTHVAREDKWAPLPYRPVLEPLLSASAAQGTILVWHLPECYWTHLIAWQAWGKLSRFLFLFIYFSWL